MMRLVYLVPNVSWVFLFGDAPTRLDGEPLFYRTRSEALAAAERKGLQVDKRGRVSALSSNAGEGTNG